LSNQKLTTKIKEILFSEYMVQALQIQKWKQLTGHEASIFALTAGRDERHFLSGAGDGWVVAWNLDEPDPGRLIAKVETQIFTLEYLPDLEVVVVGNMNGGLHWVDLRNPQDTLNIDHHQKGVFGIRRIGDSLFTVGGGGVLTRWSVPERRSLESFQLTNRPLRCIDYSPQRNELAVGASDHAIYLLDAQTLALRHTIHKAHDNSVFAVRYSPDQTFLFSGGRDAHLRRWQLEDYTPANALPAHWFTLNHIALHPQGKWLATASRDKTIKIWNPQSCQLIKVLDTVRNGGHLNSVNRLYWSGYRNQLISTGDDRSIIIWNVEDQ